MVLETVAFLVLPLLTYLSHTRTRRSSTIVLIFWLAYFPALLIWTRTTLLVTPERNSTILALRWSVSGLRVVAFALECLGPEFRAEPDDKPRSNPESPLLTANIFSVWTFGWLTPLMKKGARQFITEDDLPELVPADEAINVGQKLQRNMKKQYVLFSLFYCAALHVGLWTHRVPFQQILMDGFVCLVRGTLRSRGLLQAHSRLPCFPSASTLASLSLVYLFVSKRKTKWHGRTPGPKCG